MRTLGRCFLVLQVTFLGTLAVLVAHAGGLNANGLDALKTGVAVAGGTELVLIPAALLIVRFAAACQTFRYLKIGLRLWALIPLTYTLFGVFFVLRAQVNPWSVVRAYFVYAPYSLLVLSIVWLPMLVVSTLLIERWTRPAPTFF